MVSLGDATIHACYHRDLATMGQWYDGSGGPWPGESTAEWNQWGYGLYLFWTSICEEYSPIIGMLDTISVRL